ncbi:MAG: hypothetical protein P9M14_16305 [Candidatus Alcyoniella australis]|nr:hypothetical protein [Candidatus Alcyoniella australis]
MSDRASKIKIALLCFALLLAAGLALADVPHSRTRDVPYTINQFPSSYDPWEQYDESLMYQWDTFANVMYPASSPPGTFGAGNGKNEYAGFLTNSQVDSYYGFTWGGAAAMTISWWDHTGHISESDIAWNAHLNWTTDIEDYLEDSSILPYQLATIHELGHTFGLDDYDYDKSDDKSVGYETVMNYSHPWHNYALGLDDGQTVQKMYPSRQNTVHDLGIYDFHCTSQFSCPDASKSTGSVACGRSFEIDGIQIANLGNYSESNVSATFYLSEDINISSSDVKLGTISFGSLASRSRSIVDVELTVPSDTDIDTYYVGAIISGASGDALSENNSMFLPGQIRVTSSGGGGGDDDEPNDPQDCERFCEVIDSCSLASEIDVSSWDECVNLCEIIRHSVLECVLDATYCSEVADCIGAGDDSSSDDEEDACCG